jgi:GTP cyclohydrolase I
MYLEKVVKERPGYEADMTMRREAIKDLLSTIPNEDPDREGLLDTPNRVAKMYEEIFGGYEMDPHEILSKTFDAGKMHDEEDEETSDIYSNGLVIVKDIPFYSHCEHHMVPFFGHAHVAYIPGERVVGLSKIARLVECYARRLQIQERLTNQIADAIIQELDPIGVMVVIQAEHLCMAMRGVKKPGANTITSSVHGVFTSNSEARSEVLNLLDLKNK